MNFEPLLKRPINDDIAMVARYFAELAPGDSLPKRADFKPGAIKQAIKFIFLLDILPGHQDYRYAIIGDEMAILFGHNGTHTLLSDHPNKDACNRLRATYDAVAASRTYQYIRGRYTWPDRSLNIERLLIPMTGPDGTLTNILGVVIPDAPADMLPVLAGIGITVLEADETITGPVLTTA